MSKAGKVFAVVLLVALAWAVAPVAAAQPPIRIGASLSQTGAWAPHSQGILRGYQLCVRQMGHKLLLFQWQDGKRVIVWPEELAPGKPRFPTPPWNQRP